MLRVVSAHTWHFPSILAQLPLLLLLLLWLDVCEIAAARRSSLLEIHHQTHGWLVNNRVAIEERRRTRRSEEESEPSSEIRLCGMCDDVVRFAIAVHHVPVHVPRTVMSLSECVC